MPELAAAVPPEKDAGALRPSLVDALREDAHWQRFYWRERYHRPEFGYEDYAPAYCVGYVGFAQYGGSFDDAEKSLLANWLRIRGDSGLNLEDAGMAMRAAWDRMAQTATVARSLPAMDALAADALAGGGRQPREPAAAMPSLLTPRAAAEAEIRAQP